MSIGYALLNITDSEVIEKINKFSHQYIPKTALAESGRETEYHITVLANVEEDSDRIIEYVEGIDKTIDIELGKVSKFRNECDVLKIEVKGKDIDKLHNIFKEKFKNSETYDGEFSPHITIAYVKPGKLEELVGNKTFEGIKLSLNLFKFSTEDDNDILFQKIGKVFHKDIGFPEQYKYPLRIFNIQLNRSPVRFTQHYYTNEERDFNVDNYLTSLELNVNNIFEFTTNEMNQIEKVVYRYKYNDRKDICFSCSNRNHAKNIITFWFNSNTDVHKTLDKSRYSYASMNITNQIFEYLQSNYDVDRGDCFGIALALKNVFGGDIYGIYRDDEPEYALHCLVKINGILYDGKGIRNENEIIEYYSGYDEETEQEEQATLEFIDDEVAENLLGESQAKLNTIEEVNNLIMKLKQLLNKQSIKKLSYAEDSQWKKDGKYWQYLEYNNYKASVGPNFFNRKVVSWTAFIKDSTDLVLENKTGFETVREAKQYAFQYIENRMNKQSIKKTAGLGYGGWISPTGEYNEVEFQGHESWAHAHRKKLKLVSPQEDWTTDLIAMGWIRYISPSNFYFYDLAKCVIIDTFIFENNIKFNVLHLDCEVPFKSFSITYKEYEESDFNLKSAISHSRDIRGKKIRTVEDAVKKDMIQQNCKHEFGEIQTDNSNSMLKGYKYRTCKKCGLRDFTKVSIIKLSKYFDKTKTGMPLYDNMLQNKDYYEKEKGISFIIKYMTPDEYINICSNELNIGKQDWLSLVDKETINNYSEQMKQGDIFPMPVLDYTNGFMQEGRHRIVVAKQLGINEIPILIVKRINKKSIKDKALVNGTEVSKLAYQQQPDKTISYRNKNINIFSVPSKEQFVNEYVFSIDDGVKIGNYTTMQEAVRDAKEKIDVITKKSIKQKIKLYHVTDKKNTKSILKNGFQLEYVNSPVWLNDYAISFFDNINETKQYSDESKYYSIFEVSFEGNIENSKIINKFDSDLTSQEYTESMIEKNIDAVKINPNIVYVYNTNCLSNIKLINNINKKSKKTKLQFIDSTDLVKALKLLKSLQYHQYQYTIESDGLLFNRLDDLQDVKKLLDKYHIGNLIKTAKNENIEVEYWDFDDRNSYNFVMKDDDGNEIATLQTETYNEYKHGVFDIEVKPEFRRKGLATKLFMYAKKYLKNKLIELVHSADNLSDDGRAFKNSFSSIYVDYTSLDELKQFMKQFLQNKSCGLNINELDSIFVYRELINWLQKNAKKELNVISKILKI